MFILLHGAYVDFCVIQSDPSGHLWYEYQGCKPDVALMFGSNHTADLVKINGWVSAKTAWYANLNKNRKNNLDETVYM